MKKVKDQLKSVSKTLAGLTKQIERVAKELDKAAKAPVARKAPAKRKVAAKKVVKKKVAAKKVVRKKVAAKKAPAKQAKRGRKAASDGGILDSVFSLIKKSKKGISIPALKDKTDFDPRQISNALYKLTNKGMVKTVSRGIYAKK